ncbi:MAG TPA: spore cortex biosynthesis protein YabQ [Tepidimicrobium sp.]|nr:spore cortex biosynthesis protein YabQ [Tepidimicrobium sp.]
MEHTTGVQVYIFLTSLYGGLIAGFFYDIYRISRYYFKPKNVATVLEDLIFWIGVALIFFYILNRSNWIELRAYIFIGFFVGGIIYLKVISRILFPLLIKTCDKVAIAIKKAMAMVGVPFKYIDNRVSYKVKGLRKIRKVFREVIGNIKKYTSIIFRKK